MYWSPWLADRFSLRPTDLGDLTPYQLDACFDYAEATVKL